MIGSDHHGCFQDWRPAANCFLIALGEKRTRILEDMAIPESFHMAKVIMMLLSPVFLLLIPSFPFFIIQLPHNSFALTLSWDVRLLYYTGNY